MIAADPELPFEDEDVELGVEALVVEVDVELFEVLLGVLFVELDDLVLELVEVDVELLVDVPAVDDAALVLPSTSPSAGAHAPSARAARTVTTATPTRSRAQRFPMSGASASRCRYPVHSPEELHDLRRADRPHGCATACTFCPTRPATTCRRAAGEGQSALVPKIASWMSRTRRALSTCRFSIIRPW